MIYKEALPGGQWIRVTFELPASIWAARVTLVGDFNHWDTGSHELRQSSTDGTWRITIELEAGREYQFRYLIDGRDWQTDWHADGNAPNGYGGYNSIVAT